MPSETINENKTRTKLASAILLSGVFGEAECRVGGGADLSKTVCDASGFAHARQHFRPSGFSWEQYGQIMALPDGEREKLITPWRCMAVTFVILAAAPNCGWMTNKPEIEVQWV